MPTKIEWVDETWPVVAGCSRVSEGCDNCYAATMTGRLGGMMGRKVSKVYEGLVGFDAVLGRSHFNGEVRELEENLDLPLSWKKGRRVLVASMSDLFHPRVTVGYQRRVFDVMLNTLRHTYKVLTKRPRRAAALWGRLTRFDRRRPQVGTGHIQLGISAENQKWFAKRLPYLLARSSPIKFLSLEPLLGPIILPAMAMHPTIQVIVGGESGPRARPMDPAWVRAIRNQCVDLGVPFFFKQWGNWAPESDKVPVRADGGHRLMPSGVYMHKCKSKKTAGRLLDGRTWDQEVLVRG